MSKETEVRINFRNKEGLLVKSQYAKWQRIPHDGSYLCVYDEQKVAFSTFRVTEVAYHFKGKDLEEDFVSMEATLVGEIGGKDT